MLICPQCSAANPLDEERCRRCGLSLADAIGPDDDPEDAATLAVASAEKRCPTVHLVLTLGREVVRELRSDRAMINIGREPTQDISIDNAGISRQHCRICFEHGRFFLRDLGSENGVELNGERVEGAELRPGDSIELGKYAIYFEPDEDQLARLERSARPSLASRGEEVEEAATAILREEEQDRARHDRQRRQAAHLRRLDKRGRALERYGLGGSETLLGRGPEVDVPLSGWFLRPEHALIEVGRGGFVLRSLGGVRGVFVNGEKVEGKRPLRHHDRITIGGTSLRFFEAV
jgi:pSer/pThr/pTyr-binding forkhead associated (FHA) protein